MGSPRRTALVSIAILFAASCSSPPPRPPRAPGDDPFARYLPRDYHLELMVDYDGMRDLDLLEWIDEMPLAPGFFTSLAREYGCELDDLHRVRTGYCFAHDSSRPWQSDRGVSVAERSTGAGIQMTKHWKPQRLHGFEGFEQDIGAGRSVAVFPEPGIAVVGDPELIEASLASGGGGPHPDLAPLIPGENVLGQAVIGRFGHPMHEATGTFGWFWHDENDQADFVRLRLVRGDGDHVVVEVLVRFQKGDTGLAEVERDLRKGLDGALAKPELRAIHDLAKSVEVRREGRDLSVSIDLGTPRQAWSAFERLFAAMAALRSRG